MAKRGVSETSGGSVNPGDGVSLGDVREIGIENPDGSVGVATPLRVPGIAHVFCARWRGQTWYFRLLRDSGRQIIVEDVSARVTGAVRACSARREP